MGRNEDGMTEELAIDHVILAVRDLDSAAARLLDEHGLVAAGGGVHPGGTKNLAVVLEDGSYVELLAVHDETKPFAQRLERFLQDGDGLFHFALRTTNIDAFGVRVGITPQGGSIETSDGSIGHWRTVAGGRASRLPFVIQYEGHRTDEMRAEAVARHRVRPKGFAWVEFGGDQSVLDEWVGGASLPIRVVDAEPGIRAAGIATEADEIVLRQRKSPAEAGPFRKSVPA
jgi:hypothetical protein